MVKNEFNFGKQVKLHLLLCYTGNLLHQINLKFLQKYYFVTSEEGLQS